MKLAPVHGHANDELDNLRLPSTSLSTIPISNRVAADSNRTDFKVVYVNGCDDVTMTSDQNGQGKL